MPALIIILAVAGFFLTLASGTILEKSQSRDGGEMAFAGFVCFLVSYVFIVAYSLQTGSDQKYEEAAALNYAHKCINAKEDVTYEWGPGVTDSNSIPKCKEVKND